MKEPTSCIGGMACLIGGSGQWPIEVVGPIGDDMRIGQTGDAHQVFVIHGLASRLETGEDLCHTDRVLHEHGVGEQAQIALLVYHLLIVAGAKDPLIGE